LWSWIAEARTDVEIARGHGAKVVTHAWTNFAEQKNIAAAAASHDWILSLDADEELSGTLHSSLLEWKGARRSIPSTRWRDAPVLGGWIKHSGWYPDFNDGFTAAMRRALTASSTSPCNSKANRDVAWDLLHYTMRSFAEHEEKVERYAALAAQQLYAEGKRSWRPLNGWRCLGAGSEFLPAGGFLDGYRGALIAKWPLAQSG